MAAEWYENNQRAARSAPAQTEMPENNGISEMAESVELEESIEVQPTDVKSALPVGDRPRKPAQQKGPALTPRHPAPDGVKPRMTTEPISGSDFDMK